MTTFVKAEDLVVGYESSIIVDGVSFEIEKGQILTLIGPNGSGKSTILKTIAKLLEKKGGSVYIGKDEISHLNEKDIAKKMSMLLTGRLKTELMTCFDVVSTGRYPFTGKLGILSDNDRQIVKEALEMVNISELADRDFSKISDGQRQRVLLARAICQSPEIVLLDEPTSYLDIRYKLELLEILKHLAKTKGITIITSLHEIELAARIADKVICIKDKKVFYYGDGKKAFSKDIVTKLYDITDSDYNDLFSSIFKDDSVKEFDTNIRFVNNKLLRCGYTTGSCAAGASKAAAQMLTSGKKVDSVKIMTPKGKELNLGIEEIEMTDEYVKCAVRKDAGDDPDITNGTLVFSKVSKIAEGINIDGGLGVGRVTKPGLDQPVGNAAINSTPRRMIKYSVMEAARENSYTGGFDIEISIPDGVNLAKKTFNPKLGIVGGISVLGTSGIVEPMSDNALIESIRREISVIRGQGANELMIVLGNYGESFAKDILGLDTTKNTIMCSNFIGAAFDAAVEYKFEKVLLIGHIGKLVKLGIGMFNTHSNNGDGRIDIFVTCAVQAGADLETIKKVSECITTDAALDVLTQAGLTEKVMAILNERILDKFERKLPSEMEVGFICFTNAPVYGSILTQSENANILAEIWRNNK